MLTIPSVLQTQFDEYLHKKAVPANLQAIFKKWLRYYLDFCQKYHFSAVEKESLPRFIEKLRQKKQMKVQQEQAIMAVTVYYDFLRSAQLPGKTIPFQPGRPPQNLPSNNKNIISQTQSPIKQIQYQQKVIPTTLRNAALSSLVPGPASASGRLQAASSIQKN